MIGLKQDRQEIEALKEFVQRLRHLPSPVVEFYRNGKKPHFPFVINSENGIRILLIYHALKQDVRADILLRFLLKCWQNLGESIFCAQQLPYNEVMSLIKEDAIMNGWVWSEKFPGILRSIGDYLFVAGGLFSHLRTFSHSEELVADITRSIFFMGKTSFMKYKARSFAIDLRRYLIKDVPNWWNAQSLVATSPGAFRMMKKIGPVKADVHSFNSELRQLIYYNRFYNFLFPGNSWMVARPFETFQNPLGDLYRYECEYHFGGCSRCSLCDFCDKANV